MSESTAAVFLSYASQDQLVAERICQALRAADIEVWFDRSELRGGESWDRKIRQQIGECLLFLAIVSKATESRPEGYFRLEWRLAVDRSLRFSDSVAFVVPIVVDDLPPQSAEVPDAFRSVQWMKLPAGEPNSQFVSYIKHLLRERVARKVSAAPSHVPTPVFPSVPGSWPSRKHAAIAFLALLLIAAAGAGVWYSLSYRPQHVVASTTEATDALSVIVVPFANQTGDIQKAYIADAVTSNIAAELALIPDIYVVPVLDASNISKGTATLQTTAREAHVRFVLTGDVQSAGSRLRIGVQLFDAKRGSQIWVHTFEGDIAKLFDVQDQIAVRVSNNMGAEMLNAVVRDKNEVSLEASSSDLLLRARALALKPLSSQTSKQSEDLYRDLLKREPDNPMLMVSLGKVLVDTALMGLERPHTLDHQRQMIGEAQSLAERSREREFNSPDIDYVSGWCALYLGDFALAGRRFQAVLQRLPKSASSYNNLGVLAYTLFQPKNALEQFARAQDLIPGRRNDFLLLNIAFANLQMANYDAAIESSEKALEVSPHLEAAKGVAAVAYALNGDMASGRAWADKAKRAGVMVSDLGGAPKGSQAYEDWMRKVILPMWTQLDLD